MLSLLWKGARMSLALSLCVWVSSLIKGRVNEYRLSEDFRSMRDSSALLDQTLPAFKHPLIPATDPDYPDYYRAGGDQELFEALLKLRQWTQPVENIPAPNFATLQEKFALADMVTRFRPVDCARVECVALTFDDGPSVYTDGILDVLEEYQGKGTFYVLGQMIRHHPATLKRMAREGHEVANHTWSHPDLRTISTERITTEMTRAEAEIHKYTGIKTTNMRPPYGSFDARVAGAVRLPLIMWSIDTSDWQHRDTLQTIARATTNTRGGDIVLMHDIHEPTARAVPEIVRRLTARKMVLVTVNELLREEGLVANRTYTRAKGGARVSTSEP